jgi:hypothetical protein
MQARWSTTICSTRLTATVPYNDQGIWMINMGLGQPQGNCVGWSAYDGPNPTFNANNPAPNYCTQPTQLPDQLLRP